MPWARIVEESRQKKFCKIPEKRESSIRRPIIHLVIYKIIPLSRFFSTVLNALPKYGFPIYAANYSLIPNAVN